MGTGIPLSPPLRRRDIRGHPNGGRMKDFRYATVCGQSNRFRVAAYGDGRTFARTWGQWSDSKSITLPCPGTPTPTPSPTATPTPSPTATPSPVVASLIRVGSSTITEGGDAIFALTASPKPTQSIDVKVTISQDGDFVKTGVESVTMNRSGRASLYISTDDYKIHEPDGSVTATLQSGTGYQIDNRRRSATVNVRDNDLPPTPTATPTPLTMPTILTHTAGNHGEFVLSWNPVRGATGYAVGAIDNDIIKDVIEPAVHVWNSAPARVSSVIRRNGHVT